MVCGERKKRGAEEGQARISIAAMRFQLAGPTRSESCGLRRLVTRGDATSSGIPTARWSSTVAGDAVAASRYGSFVSVEDLELDSRAFGISAAEAESMDPQQVFVLHVGYGALVSGAGRGEAEQVREGLVYSEVGVFVGVEPSGLVMRARTNVFSASGGAASITSGRLSYALGLVGPCYTIDTACSSALAALHACAGALRGGECESSVGVGTKVLSEGANYGTAVAGMTSERGRCHTFDGRADGYSRGEGCAAFRVEAETMAETVAAGSRGYRGTVVGSAVQQDGPSASLTAPNGSSQRRLLETVR